MFTHLNVIMHKIKHVLVYKYVYIPHLNSSDFFFFLNTRGLSVSQLTDTLHEIVYFLYCINYIVFRKKV